MFARCTNPVALNDAEKAAYVYPSRVCQTPIYRVNLTQHHQI